MRRHVVLGILAILVIGTLVARAQGADPWGEKADPWGESGAPPSASPPSEPAPAAPAVRPSPVLSLAPAGAVDEYAHMLREQLEVMKVEALARVQARLESTHEEKLELVSDVLGYLSLAGLLLLLAPLYLRKVYPGQTKLLIKTSALAAVTFVIAMQLFSFVMVLLRAFQDALATGVNPQLAIVEGGFDAMANNADLFAQLGQAVLGAPLAQVAAGTHDNLPIALLENMGIVRSEYEIFANMARVFEGLQELLATVPSLIAILTMLVFLIAIKDVFVDIIRLPGEVASGRRTARGLIPSVMRKIGAELVAVLMLMVLLVFATLLAGIGMTVAVQPAMELFVLHLYFAIAYVTAETASPALVYISLGGCLAFLVLNVLVTLVASVLYLRKAHHIFRLRMHDKVPLRRHRFWRRGTGAFFWAEMLPVIYVIIASVVIAGVVGSLAEGDSPSWAALLLAGPAILVPGFVLCFWLLRGLRVLAYLAKFPIVDARAVRGSVAPPRR